MAVKRDYSNTPEYWSVDPATFDLWVAELGYAAAGKLMAACANYFLHGTEPDEIKLTKSAANMFEAERGKLDRRRALAMKARRGSAKPAASVDNSKSWHEVSEKPKKSLGKTSKKSPRNPSADKGPSHVPTSANGSYQQTPIKSQSRNQSPQTPAPSDSARGSGAMSRAEFDALLRGGLGYDSPNAYGIGAEIVAGG